MNKDDRLELVHGSGNIWQDFGYPDADIRQAKGILAVQIIGILDDRKLSVRQAAERTGFAAADFSRIRNADYGRFTIDRLMRMLLALDRNLEVTVDIRPRSTAEQQPALGLS